MLAEVKRFWSDDQNKKNILIILLCYWVLNLIVYLPFIFHWGTYGRLEFGNNDTSVFARYWDGPFYAGVAKTMYDPGSTYFDHFDLAAVEYYTNHFPLFPLFIKAAGVIMPLEVSLLFVNAVFGVAGVVLLYYFFVIFLPKKEAAVLSLIGLVIPLRILVLRNVGNSEMVFFVFVVLLMIFAVKKRYYWAIIMAVLATLTRQAGVFLFPAFLIITYIYEQRNWRLYLASTLIPLTFIAVYLCLYMWVGGYELMTRQGGFQMLVTPPPFSVMFLMGFNASGIFYLYLAYLIGIITALRDRMNEKLFKVGIISAFAISYVFFSVHQDNSRYLWPFFAFAVLLPLNKIFQERRVQLALLILLPAILLNVWSIIVSNQMPIEWFGRWLQAIR
ncbi:glycosyltransferase family 39 protein [candidate division WWE3 bacterium]|uniref:Glycosyltransferase family 39 protein n=1 Tax=candidate division WWE3 bacterium TaxID=2053526 RepID=A0A955LL61_UNCKA|nr:glycosyltransferase family 39 protein [candidate division WWE3 bacterium]